MIGKRLDWGIVVGRVGGRIVEKGVGWKWRLWAVVDGRRVGGVENVKS